MGGIGKTGLMELSNVNLALFFTGGVGLKTWAEVGNLEREVTIYQQLTEHLKCVNFVTYGGREDRQYSDRLGNIGLYPIQWNDSISKNLVSLLMRHWRMLRQTDVLKTNQIRGSEIPIWFKRRFGKKFILRCGWLWSLNFEKETDDEQAINKVRAIEKNAFEAADIAVVTTVKNRQHVINRYGISEKKLRVIPNYVETERFCPTSYKRNSKAAWKICFVGRYSPEKNLSGLLNALYICRNRLNKSIYLDLYGSGLQSATLRKIVEELRLDVRFHGNIPSNQLPEKLSNVDLFILPSLYENHPKSLIEAMSCGLPCVGSDVEGIKELINHRKTGYLCQTDAQSIANAIEVVLSDETLRLKIGENARKYVIENLALEKVLRMELDVIQEVVTS